MKNHLTRRALLQNTAKLATGLALGATLSRLHAQNSKTPRRIFDVRDFGATGDGTTLDSAAIQRAIDEAAAAGRGAQVLLRGGKRYLIGALELKAGIEFHLADDAELFVSTDPAAFRRTGGAWALNADGLRITGTGTINGRSPEFMDHFDAADEWWRPKPFRPRLAVLTGCKDLESARRDVSARRRAGRCICWAASTCSSIASTSATSSTCRTATASIPTIAAMSRSGTATSCAATTRSSSRPRAGNRNTARRRNIRVSDCVFETQDSGVKIGTETVQDISDVRFERCEIKTGCRGICIQLRDEGSVYDIDFRDIKFVSRYFSAPWWGRGEGISLTAIPRTPETKIGTIHDVRIIECHRPRGKHRAHQRLAAKPDPQRAPGERRPHARPLDEIRGGVWDNRPTTAMDGIEKHGTPGFSVRHADGVSFRKCKLAWGKKRPDYFTHALEIENATGVDYAGLKGEAAHPERDQAVVVR